MGRLFLIALVAGLLGCLPAYSQEAAYEGFAYPTNTDLLYQDGGTGFDGPWIRDRNWLAGGSDIEPGSLSVGGLQTTGNRVYLTGVSFVPTQFSRALAVPFGEPGTTAWASFVMDGAAPGNCGGLLLRGLLIGDPSNSDFFGLQDVSEGFSFPGPFAPSQVRSTGRALLVVRIEFANGADKVDLFVNPTPGGTAPATPDVSVRYEFGANVDYVDLVSWGAAWGAVTYAFDELRFGGSFAAVAPASTAGPGPTPGPTPTPTPTPTPGPPGGTPAATLVGLQLGPARIMGGSTTTGAVVLSGPAPLGGAVVGLSSGNGIAGVPSSVTIPAGATSVTFPVATAAVSRKRSVKITASLGASRRSAVLRIDRTRAGENGD